MLVMPRSVPPRLVPAPLVLRPQPGLVVLLAPPAVFCSPAEIVACRGGAVDAAVGAAAPARTALAEAVPCCVGLGRVEVTIMTISSTTCSVDGAGEEGGRERRCRFGVRPSRTCRQHAGTELCAGAKLTKNRTEKSECRPGLTAVRVRLLWPRCYHGGARPTFLLL